jgi:hypothetical protein
MRNRVCVKKAATRDGYPVFSGETFISHSTVSDKTWFFFDSGNWEERQGTTIKDRGKWNCDGADNYYIWVDDEQYSSKTKGWAIMNTIFNCVKEDLESRGMKFEFETGKLKLPFRNENYFIFYEDGKWESFDKAQNKVYPGTWECDGEEAYKIFTEWQNYSSKTNEWK